MHALLIDIGNTSLKIGLSAPDAVIASYTLPTDIKQSGDSLGFQLACLLGHAGVRIPGAPIFEGAIEPLPRPEVCIISSVVPGVNPLMTHACERYLGLKPLFAHRDLPIPLENQYEHPAEVGADRLVAAFGARRLLPQARSVVSVDYGTATTFDCVTDNAYLGGLICPGVMSALGALATHTAKLPRIALATHSDIPIVGRSTVTSLNHGFLFGFAAMTEGLYTRLQNSLEGPVAFVATGGFAPDVARVVTCFDLVRPDLILEGLRLLWQENRQ
ncbi:MAG: type III pantothenate kinase [Bilophila sp.]